MYRANGGWTKHVWHWNWTISTMIRMPILWCRKRCPSFRTAWWNNHGRARPSGKLVTWWWKPNIARTFRSCWRTIDIWPRPRIHRAMRTHRHHHPNGPSVIFALFAVSHPIIHVYRAVRATVAFAAWASIRTPDASSGPRKINLCLFITYVCTLIS